MPSTFQMFSDQRKVIIEKLRGLDPDLVRELESIDLALQKLGNDHSLAGAYTAHKNAVDAVAAYLGQILRTEEMDTIAQAIVDGGWLKGNQHALKNARASLKYHVEKSALTKTIKRFPSGKIGLYSWSKDFDRT